ncbi:phosphotransferase [Arthrobacter sp.]|uniref:phosphotransferase enzyme family protein n=1 Tax=Arthrobacter sp. TaxID=1667 RepID=UPI0028125247|nr:phosphotransferase [Arthrobacter sp.]
MLPLSEIKSLNSTVDEAWRSPVADAVAAAWGLPPGAALYLRSSAAHVFIVPAKTTAQETIFLRFVPARVRPEQALLRPARLLTALSSAGHPVVSAVLSEAGRLVETLATPAGSVHAAAVTAARGEEREPETLTEDQSWAWGAALARFHMDAAPHRGIFLDPGIAGKADTQPALATSPFATLASLNVDPRLARAAETLAADWAALPGLPAQKGVLHGDFELDNLRWEGDAVSIFDLDEARIGRFAEDIASALRDIVGQDCDNPTYPALFASFLDGYASVRTLNEDEVALLPICMASNAARDLLQRTGVLDVEPAAGDSPPWLPDLRSSLVNHYDEKRSLILRVAEKTLN